MPLWRYEVLSRVASTAAFFSRNCIFCAAGLDFYSNVSGSIAQLPVEPVRWRSGDRRDEHLGSTTYTICGMCGWWTMLHSEEMESPRGLMAVHRGAIGALKNIDSIDVQMPLDEIQQYLLAKRDASKTIDWRLMEETVGDVFRSLGFDARVTNRSNDGGIDVILTDSAGGVVGVQVKRYKNKISADQMRSFTGALMNRGITQGIFVTTSSFQPGAEEEAVVATSRGYPIELVDGEAFYEAMGIARLEQGPPPFSTFPSTFATRRLWRSPVG